MRRSKKALLIPFAALAMAVSLGATAFACTIFRGTFTIRGNGSSASVTATGLRTGMTQTVSSGVAKATATGGSVTISTGRDAYGVGLPARGYQVRYYNGAGYRDHTHWQVDCMAGGPGVTLGSVSMGADGKIVGQPKTFGLPASRKNIFPQESAVCLSDSFATYGNQAPLTIM